jgi:hypothetical protein
MNMENHVNAVGGGAGTLTLEHLAEDWRTEE